MKQSIMIELTLDIVPKKNGKSAGITNSGRPYVYSRKAARDSQNDLAKEIMTQCAGWRMTDKPVKVTAFFKKRRGDCIGAMETLLDAMEGIIYKNDSQVWDQRSHWDYRGFMPVGRTAEVTITIL